MYQSGFCAMHSTESALLNGTNDLRLTADSKGSVLLDLTAAFNTVDHAVLLERLEHFVGLKGKAIQWIASYLPNRTFLVNREKRIFKCCTPLPLGSILLVFTLFIASSPDDPKA